MKKKVTKQVNINAGKSTKRERRMSLLLSDSEQRIIDNYLSKYKIKNKSRWLRETVLAFIHKNMEDDYPTLFAEHDMRR
ncbi:MAG: hypothetical protein Q3992_05385 [Bacteroides sp.]|nr:hypothetical protein [Bacteroides sp.]